MKRIVTLVFILISGITASYATYIVNKTGGPIQLYTMINGEPRYGRTWCDGESYTFDTSCHFRLYTNDNSVMMDLDGKFHMNKYEIKLKKDDNNKMVFKLDPIYINK